VAPLLLLVAFVLFSLGSVLVRRVQSDPLADANSGTGLGGVDARSVPEFDLPLFDGSALKASELRGKVTVINFWSSWCVPCQREMTLLSRLAKEYEGQDVTFVGVALWDSRGDAEAFFNRYGAGYRAGIDERGAIAIDLGVGGLPETFFVAPDGTIRRKWLGELNEVQVRRFIDEIRA